MTRIPDRCDLLVVGGGINGAGIARDAAGRGLQVVLVERGDLAGATSMASSKLVHGGLRYLEQGALRLVHESLVERETLMRAAPHLVRPLHFVLPQLPGGRPGWMVRTGLALYDLLARGSTLPGSRSLRLQQGPLGVALRPEVERGFSYYDCRTDDARLVLANAVDAAEHGATVLTRTECLAARPDGGRWRVALREPAGSTAELSCRAVVNAGGPWVAEVLARAGLLSARARVRLVKGSHIVVPRRYDGEHAYLLAQPDGRVVFALPFEDDYTLIGTTDVPLQSMPAEVSISEMETTYLLQAFNRYFRECVSMTDVVWSYAGVRGLYDDGKSDPSRVTRDYVLRLDHAHDRAPLLSVFGGKLTTYRRLAERVLDKLREEFPQMSGAWTAQAVLPGGDVPHGDVEGLAAKLAMNLPSIPRDWLAGLVWRHGSRAAKVLGSATDTVALGEHFGAGVTAREVDYLVEREWACTADDILWRRTKAGLRVGAEQRARLERYVAGRGTRETPADPDPARRPGRR